MFNIIHCIDKDLVSSIDKEIIYDSKVKEVLPSLFNKYNKYPIVMGYRTWKSIGERPIGRAKNIVVSRKPRKLPRGITQIKSVVALANSKDIYNIIGGVSLINSIPQKTINEVHIFQIKKSYLENISTNEYTIFPNILYYKTSVVEDTYKYTYRLWRNNVDF